MGVTKDRGRFYWVKRVPKRYTGLVTGQDGKPVTQVRQALHTSTRAEAEVKAAQVEAERMAEWEALLAGRSDDARRHYLAARDLAQAYGFQYQPSKELLTRTIADNLPRLLAALGTPEAPTSAEVTRALLGGVERSTPTMAGVLDEYLDLTRTRHLKKSEAQKHRWLTSRRRVVSTFNTVVSEGRSGPPPVDQITREVVLQYRDFWSKRVEAGTHSAQTANKEFGHLAEVFSTWAELTGHQGDNPFKRIKLDGEADNRRPPFSRDWVAEKILAPGALDRLNNEARDILLVMINTGLRPSEVTDAPLSDLCVDAAIPHLVVAPHGRELKVAHTRREIPLVGVSLDAARRIVARGGVTRYEHKASAWSALVNKYLSNNGLKETASHTPYSLRHYVEDALLLAGVDDRIRADILGHKYKRPIYGDGGGLATRREALQKIAL